MRIGTLILAILFCSPIWGQFGARAKYNINRFSDFNSIPLSSNGDIFSSSLEIGLDYWLGMNNYRVEIMPELSYERSSDNIISGFDATFSSINFIVNGNFYFLDFQGDCDCPTFSKEGGMVSKGLHMIVSPGISKFSFSSEDLENGGNINWNAGLGLGLDLGINDLITITPFILYKYRPGIEWEALRDIDPNESISSSGNQFQIGIRMGFRPDYQKPRFRN